MSGIQRSAYRNPARQARCMQATSVTCTIRKKDDRGCAAEEFQRTHCHILYHHPALASTTVCVCRTGKTMNIIEKSRETVEQLLARRNLPKTYEEKCQYALDLVDMYLHEENPDRIDECIKLYTEDAVWETPARNVSYRGRETIKNMYLRVFNSAQGITFHPIERFATP